MKLNQDSATELPLNDESSPKPKMNRHIVIALKHMNTRRGQLTERIEALTKERDDLDASLKAFE